MPALVAFRDFVADRHISLIVCVRSELQDGHCGALILALMTSGAQELPRIEYRNKY
jgi:hypothetical protein